MDRLSDQFLAGAIFTLNQDGGVSWCNPLQPIDQLMHLAADIHDPFKAESFVQPLAQFEVLATQTDGVRCLLRHRA